MTHIYTFPLTPPPRHILADFLTASQLDALKHAPQDDNRPKGRK